MSPEKSTTQVNTTSTEAKTSSKTSSKTEAKKEKRGLFSQQDKLDQERATWEGMPESD